MTWYKRIHVPEDNGRLVQSSDEVIENEKMEEAVSDMLRDVFQVVTDRTQTNQDTANNFFPHLSPDFIRYKNVDDFNLKLSTTVYTDTVVVIVSPQQLKMLTGIVDDAFFAIHTLEYKLKNEKLCMGLDNVVTHGSVHSYITETDKRYCNELESEKTLKTFVNGKYCNWLGLVRDDVLLHKLRILQAHDASTGFMDFYNRHTWKFAKVKYLPDFVGSLLNRSETVAKWSITQDLTIAEQLSSGVRSFDLRVFVNEAGEACMHHGLIIVKVNFFDLINTLLSFIHNHPAEFVYTLLKFSGPGAIDTVWNTFVERCGDKLKTPTLAEGNTLKVSDVRGKIIAWSAEKKYTDINDITSYYKTFDQPNCTGELTAITRDWKDFKTLYEPCFPLRTDRENLFVFQLHSQIDATKIKNQKGGGAILASSRQFNGHALQWLRAVKPSRPLNVIEMDYIRTGFVNVFIWKLNSHNLKIDARKIFDRLPDC
jgi:hypothetical protein